LIGSIKKSDLKITQDDIDVIANQKNISYSKIDIENDIIFILKQYIVINNTNGNENRQCIENLFAKLFTNENNEINQIVNEEKNKININTFFEKIRNVLFDLNQKEKKEGRYISADKTQLVLLDFLNYKNLDAKKSYIDLKYKNDKGVLETINVKNIEVDYSQKKYKKINNCEFIEKPDEVYDVLTERDVPVTVFGKAVNPNPKSKRFFNEMLESIKKEINEKVEIYNKNYSNLSNISTYSRSQLIAIDINIDKAVKSMEILKNMIWFHK
jgi:hypothetical protein